MACVPSTLVASASAFAGLDDHQFNLATVGLLTQWAAASSPGLDVSPAAIVKRAVVFQGLDEKALDLAMIQLLCNIRGI